MKIQGGGATLNDTSNEVNIAERIQGIQETLGMVDECPPCNIAGVVGAFVGFHEEQPAFDVSLLTAPLPNDTQPEEWMSRIRQTVKACDAEVVDCDTAGLILEALETKLEQLGEPYAREVSEPEPFSSEG